MKKTAMQELIDIIKNHADTCKGKDRLRVEKAYRDIACAIDDFNILEKEKQQIVEAFKQGQIFEGREQEIWEKCEEYYSETFKNDKNE